MGEKMSLCETAASLLFVLCASFIFASGGYAVEKQRHIVLLGASVGEAWRIEDLPKRLGIQGYRFEYVGPYEFDKSVPLREILGRTSNKPDAIFIKECAAYFPGDFSAYQEYMKNWVAQCRQAGVVPIPTTVAPVIRDRSLKMKLKDFIKKLIGRPTGESRFESRLAGLIQYNDWIKSFAQKEGLTVLDLETPLRVSNTDRSLRLDLHRGDGLHLNEKAYALLDPIVIPTLESIFPK
jgi:hypothetical protein